MYYAETYPGKPVSTLETNDNGTGSNLTDEERAQRYAEYIGQQAASGQVEEVDVFTLPGGARDGEAPGWWFINEIMAQIIGAADRNPAPVIDQEPDPQPVPMGVTMTGDEAFEAARLGRWRLVKNIDYNPSAALYREWCNHPEWGSPCDNEVYDSDGNAYQSFTAVGEMRWNAGTGLVEDPLKV